jgi:hypothetical protein
VIDKGYERRLRNPHYPNVALPNSEELGEGEIKYSYEREAIEGMPLRRVLLKVDTERATVTYEYFEAIQ